MAQRKVLTLALSRRERGRERRGYGVALLVERARAMRKKPTRAEAVLWEVLRDRQLCGVKFRRQHHFSNYICDFYCEEAKLVVECDGSSHDTPANVERDKNRDRILKAHGLTILRFRNEGILNDIKAVLHKIAAYLPAPTKR